MARMNSDKIEKNGTKIMNGFVKLGYILVGAGLGMFAATLMYEKEMRKPIGDIEEYIPTDDRDEDEKDSTDISEDKDTSSEVSSEFSKADTHILDYYKSDVDDSIGVKSLEDRAKKRREKFEKSRAEMNRNQTTRYSKMYEGNSDTSDIDEERERRVAEMLQAQRDANVDFNRRMDQKAQEARKKNRDADYMAYITQESGMPVDIPRDDEPYDDSDDMDNELIRERVENNFEIYLGENPQDFVSLIFYEGDNTLADERDHVVPAADEVVGLVALSRLIEGGPGVENGVIFVRNLKTMINYEVVLQAGSYAETVLGIFDSRRNKGAGGDVNRR